MVSKWIHTNIDFKKNSFKQIDDIYWYISKATSFKENVYFSSTIIDELVFVFEYLKFKNRKVD